MLTGYGIRRSGCKSPRKAKCAGPRRREPPASRSARSVASLCCPPRKYSEWMECSRMGYQGQTITPLSWFFGITKRNMMVCALSCLWDVAPDGQPFANSAASLGDGHQAYTKKPLRVAGGDVERRRRYFPFTTPHRLFNTISRAMMRRCRWVGYWLGSRRNIKSCHAFYAYLALNIVVTLDATTR
jgi:hypothetical protein